MNKIPSDMLQFLRSAVQKKGVFSYGTKFHDYEIEGEGDYMSDIYYLSVTDMKGIIETLELVMKIATRNRDIRQHFPVNELYRNECYFYEILWPALEEYQNKVLGSTKFNMIPVCLVTKTETNYEKLIMENLKAQRYEHINKRDCFTKEQIECIFRQYGRFHAVSMAFKEVNPQLFVESYDKFHNYFSDLSRIELLRRSVQYIIDISMKYLMEEREFDVINDFQKYIKHVFTIHRNSGYYRGNNDVVLHGDSWSDNIMMKYRENGEIEDIKFVDFQLTRIGTPVHDLSYCLYSGGTEELYNQLDYFLEVYHKSLSESLLMFKCDPKVMYSFSTLKLEWREYSRYGFVMGLLVMAAKLVEDGKELNLSELILRFEDACRSVDEEEARKRILALLRHMSLYRLL